MFVMVVLLMEMLLTVEKFCLGHFVMCHITHTEVAPQILS